MARKVLAHVRDQWMGALALFLVIAGGTAYAADTIGSDDIINGQVKTVDIGNHQVRSVDVRDDTLPGGGLTGVDIADQSGVDTCTHGTARFGELCVRNDNVQRNWSGAVARCNELGLRLPSLGEATTLGSNFDIPDVDNFEELWTDARDAFGGPEPVIWVVNEDGGIFASVVSNPEETVCVTTPTN